ncbi:MAG: hypothetical protein LBK62_14260 [Treponema sp.]|nr:hypothetical protein [Treponema sp.]
MKTELETLDGNHSASEVRDSVFEYIESYYNGCIQRLTIRHPLRHYARKRLNLLSTQPGQVQFRREPKVRLRLRGCFFYPEF